MYDHYRSQKLINKKLRAELQQSNQRERTFIKLLKKTEQYRGQAEQLEQQYDKLFTEEGHSKDPEIGGQGATIEIGDIRMPKLNLSVIHVQQQAQQKQMIEVDSETSSEQSGNGGKVKTNKSA